MKQNLELMQKLLEAAKKLNPIVNNSPTEKTLIPVQDAHQISSEIIESIRFEPMGDNHHNASACPYCRQGHVFVAIKPEVARRFVNVKGPWSIDDEAHLGEAMKTALEAYGG